MPGKRHPRAKNMMAEQQLAHLGRTPEEFFKTALALDGRVAAIVHDRDTSPDGTPAAPHVHVMASFGNPRSIVQVAGELGLEPQYVQRWDGRADNGYAYLIHQTEGSKGKHRYRISEVRANFDFEGTVLSAMARAGRKGRKAKQAATPSAKVDQLINSYVEGRLDDETFYELLEPCERAKYAARIHQARIQRQQADLREWREKNAGKALTVHYFYGRAGTGKTHAAKAKGGDGAFLTKSTRDPFRGYTVDKHTLIVDDLRPETISPADMLAILSPYAIDDGVRAPARYEDVDLAVDTVYITSPYDPVSLWRKMVGDRESEVDAVEQFLRRLTTIVRFEHGALVPVAYDRRTRALTDIEGETKENPYGPATCTEVFDVDDARRRFNELGL